jgi:hypothetical protein
VYTALDREMPATAVKVYILFQVSVIAMGISMDPHVQIARHGVP